VAVALKYRVSENTLRDRLSGLQPWQRCEARLSTRRLSFYYSFTWRPHKAAIYPCDSHFSRRNDDRPIIRVARLKGDFTASWSEPDVLQRGAVVIAHLHCSNLAIARLSVRPDEDFIAGQNSIS